MPNKPNNSRWLYLLLGLYVAVSLSYYIGNGISQAMSECEEEWGEDGMLAAAETLPDGCAQQVLEHLFAEADRFTGTASQFEDMTLLLLKLQDHSGAAESQPTGTSG